MTLEAWVRPTALSGWRTVLMKEAGTEQVYAIYRQRGRWPGRWGTVRIGGTYQIAPGTAQLPLNTWTHLASTYDGTTLRLYVNGTQVGSVPASGSIDVSTGALRIGGNAIWGEYFAGLIDEVRVYNRALSQAEIQTDMNTPVGSPERLLGEAVAAGDAAPLSQQEIRPLFDEAVTRWSAALGDAEAVQRLRAVRVEVLDLPGTTLGLASGAVIYLDANGAGHGWFLDPTPWEDSEFAPGLADSPAAGRVDLLTVIAHEMGHILGLDDDSATDPFTGNVMADVLPLGVRRIHLEGLVPEAPHPSTTSPAPGAAPVLAGAAARRRDSGVRGEDLAAPVGSFGIVFLTAPVTAPAGAASGRRDAGRVVSPAGERPAGGTPPVVRLDDELADWDGPFVGISGDPLIDWEHPEDFAWDRFNGTGE